MADHSGGDTSFSGEIVGDIEEPAALAAPDEPAAPPTLNESADTTSKPGFLAKHAMPVVTALRFLCLCIFCFLYCMLVLVWVFITGNTLDLLTMYYTPKPSDEEKNGSVMQKKPTVKVKIHHLCIVTLVRLGFLVSMWMVINLSVPSLRSVPFLGSRLWKWSLLAALALLGYPILLLLYLCTFQIAQGSFSTFKGSYVQYCMTGLAQSAILVQYCTSILVIWLLCVDTSNASLRKYGSMTLASILVGAVLSVVKSAVLLWWKTKLIYRKYEGKILLAGCQLYIHLSCMGGDSQWASYQLVAWGEPMDYDLERSVALNIGSEAPSVEDYDRQTAAKRRKILPSEEYMLNKHVSLEHIHKIATCLTDGFELTLTEDDDIPDITPILRQRYASPEFRIQDVVADSSLRMIGGALLLDFLALETSKEDPTYEEFEKWMVDGLKNCYAVGSRINGAMDALRLLDRVLTGLIVFVVALVWIFMTGFATTSVIVGLASMFLGLTFVFGGTCKTFFQGVIFAFVTRPCDVGDKCIIDDKEVKKINILTTTFFGSQSKEVVIYPNSDPSIKHIVVLLHGERVSESKPKLHGKPELQSTELEDVIEFILPSATKALHIKSLRKNIEGYLEDGIESGLYKKPYRVTLKEIGESIKMGVHFYHNLDNGDEGERYETPAIRKENQRSELLLQLKELQENIENEV